jgi:protein-ribulosamine 3-kinase
VVTAAREALAGAVAAALGVAVRALRPVGGGDINEAFGATLEGGERVFVKANAHAPAELFVREAEGLAALRTAGALRVPEVLASGEAAGWRFLVLEWLESAASAPGFAARFGEGLAELHRCSRPAFGFTHDNFIGSLPQSNREHARWVDFFREERLRPQLALARRGGRLGAGALARADELLERLEDLVPGGSRPSLLHGDLWGGNTMLDERGEPALLDPAIYYGEREAELAFTELFGGFSAELYAAYRAVWPLEPGYEARRDLYNLYPLLVHTNLFGGHYAARVDQVVRRYL